MDGITTELIQRGEETSELAMQCVHTFVTQI